MKKWLVILAVIAFLPVTSAGADSILIIGGDTNMVAFTYGSTSYPSAGGGSFDLSTLDGAALPWLYCVDLAHEISLNTTYSNALVSHDGMVNGSTVDYASNVAWLLDTYASQAAGDRTKEEALQALIWSAIYGSSFTFWDTNASYQQYTDWKPAVFGSGDVSKYSWLTPDVRCTPTAASYCYQGLVTYQPVPDGGATALLLGAAMAGLAAFRRRR
jgi:hypothetical protein